MPLVGAEVQRVNAAFGHVAGELSGASRVVHELDLDAIAPASCHAAVSAGMADLRSALAGLEAVAERCVQVIGRHDIFAEDGLGQEPIP